jgi:toxin YoeB
MTPKAFEEFINWAKEDKKVFGKIVELIKDIQRSPFTGLGLPELLRGDFKGFGPGA